MSILTPLVLTNADVLRTFAGGQAPDSVAELARNLERDPSNLRRALASLHEDGLMDVRSTAPLDADLTLKAVTALKALDRADGEEDPLPEGWVALMHHEVTFDPDNARKQSGLSAASIQDMADSVYAKGFLQQPAVKPNPDAPPEWRLTMGERRWRGWGRNIEMGRWPADKKMVLRIDNGDDLAILEAGLIENLQRSDLSNLEMGEGFLTLQERYGRTAQQIAKDVSGGRTDRFVQIAIKVAKEATAEDKQQFIDSERAYWAAKAAGESAKRAFTWEDLRDTVKVARHVTALEKRTRLTLLVTELAIKVVRDEAPLQAPASWAVQELTQISTPPGGGLWAEAEGLGLIFEHREDGVIHANVTPLAETWLKDNGFAADPEGFLEELRVHVLGPMGAQLAREAKRYAIDFINAPKPRPVVAPEPAVEAKPPVDPVAATFGSEPLTPARPARDAFAEQIRQVNAADDAENDYEADAPPPEPRPLPAAPSTLAVETVPGIPDDEFVALMEIAHKITVEGIEARGGQIRGCRVGSFHSGPDAKLASALQIKRLVGFVQAPTGVGFLAYLTQLGWDMAETVDDERLEGVRFEGMSREALSAFEASGEKYVTAWVRDPAKVEAAPTPSAPLPSVAPDDEDGGELDDFDPDEHHDLTAVFQRLASGVLITAVPAVDPINKGPTYAAAVNEDEARQLGQALADSQQYGSVTVHDQTGVVLIHWGAR